LLNNFLKWISFFIIVSILYFKDTKEKGFAKRVQDAIINNIQIYVNNVHIRYEDKYSIENKVVSFGLYFRNFRAETVDINGKSIFADSNAKTIYKVGVLTGFNIYWNCDDKKESTNLDEKKEEWIVNLNIWLS
jgi:vacuolar protein sorting-associated protein 13A/C